MNDLAIPVPPLAATPTEVLQGALIDSRQRWRELVNVTADFAFETDEWGRFTLITPDPALDWPTGTLIGQPAASVLAETGETAFDPFRVTAQVRHRQAWLKRGDGGVACLTFCATPIRDASGRVTGARGVGIDRTEIDDQTSVMASALRRSEVLDHMLWRMGQEVVAANIMDAALDVLASAIGAEGAAVVIVATSQEPALVAHVTAPGRGRGPSRGSAAAARSTPHVGAGQPGRDHHQRPSRADRDVPHPVRGQCRPGRLAAAGRAPLGQ